MIDLSKDQLAIVTAILKEQISDISVYVFGSRATGKAQDYSDLDLLLKGDTPLDWKLIEELKDALSRSDLPMIVDVTDWYSLKGEIRKRIEEEMVELN